MNAFSEKQTSRTSLAIIVAGSNLCQLVEEQVTSSGVYQPLGNNAQVLLSMSSGQVLAPDEKQTCKEDFQLW